MNESQAYIGSELEIFAHAQRWKAYYKSLIAPFFGQRVLEVGAGLGATTAALCDGTQDEWICLEPDPDLLAQLQSRSLPGCCRPQLGFVATLAPDSRFDSILYIDVLEHIEDDRAELQRASYHLAPGGKLIVLSPAYPFLFSPFDESIGHYRRYTRATLSALTPPGCHLTLLRYLDSVGLLTSLANRLFLRQSLPTHAQILFWDRRLVPFSRLLDRLVGFHFGRSVVAIWEMQALSGCLSEDRRLKSKG
ncbi:MAG TPA: methyltransferase type 12 [Anaerolineae bacterium]|nr:methyltransferase type 12 [Anaerolineae bacterium]